MGDNFGLNDSYRYYEFELDSLDATSAYIGGVASTDWPLFYVAAKGPLDNVCAMKILEVQIPFSWYVFNTNNNTFTLTESTGGARLVSLPIGNYTANQLIANIYNALTAASANGRTYTGIYDSNTQKFIIWVVSSDGITPQPFTLTFGGSSDSGNRNPRLFVGFPAGATSSQGFGNVTLGNTNYGTNGTAGEVLPPNTNGTSTYAGSYMISPNAQLAAGPNYVYVNSAKLGSDMDIYLPRGAVNLSGGAAGVQCAKIPVTTNSDGIIDWQDPDPQKWFNYDAPQDLTVVDFYLTLGNTSTQTPLQLNGLSFSIKIGVLQRSNTNVYHGQGTPNNGRVTTRSGPRRISSFN